MSDELRFGRIEVRPALRQLRVDGKPVVLGSRAFDVMMALVERRDRLVSKAELIDAAWPGVVVEENNLSVQISALRRALGPDAIATVTGRGYRLTLTPTESNEGEPTVRSLPAGTLPTLPRPNGLPSIVVLPLQNLGADPADDYFSDGIVEDITLSLAGLHELMVISRGSALAYRGRSPDPREVGRALNVRYVMMGTVRRSEQLVRVSVELCDANFGAALWGEKAEVPLGELFDVQDHIVGRIVAGIAPNVRAAEMRAAMRKKPESFTAYDLTLRGLHIMNSLDPNTFLKAREFLAKAMEEDPNFAMPVAWAARWHSMYVGQGWAPDPTKHAQEAVKLATKAIELDGQNALALATYGHLKSYLFHEYDVARVYLDRALLACPSLSLAWILSSATLSYIGQGQEAVRHAEHALRLSPFDQSLFYYYMFLSLAHYASENYEDAVKCAKMSLSENWAYTATHRFLAASLGALDRLDEAREAGVNLMRLEPSFRLQIYEQSRQPFGHPDIKARLMEHLRKAGLPK